MTSPSPKHEAVLAVVPSVGFVEEDGAYYLDRKFVDGMARYRDEWGGPVRSIMRRTRRDLLPFGKTYSDKELPFELRKIDGDAPLSAKDLEGANVALVSADQHTQLHLSRISASDRPPIVYIIEYTIGTRLKIIDVSAIPAHKKIRSSAWTLLTEMKRRAALARAEGVQMNGAAAADLYGKLAASPLVYFDSRTTEDMYADEGSMKTRRQRLSSGEPLRLAFSGRFERIKGVDHLPMIAAHLRDAGVNFTLELFGAGSLEETLKADIARFDLGASVRLVGNVDFATVLSPHLKNDIDLFVCCHRQGDPSCTYLETMSCGVPIAGYANPAFAGILKRTAGGWSVGVDDATALARKIVELDRNRQAIIAAADAALDFARQHSFEKTFKRRIEHLKSVARNP